MPQVPDGKQFTYFFKKINTVYEDEHDRSYKNSMKH
jgi:hypothetical protein